MNKYAVIKIQGHQQKVEEGQEILVDRITGEPKLDVLLLVDGEKVKIGKPFLKDVVVKLKVLSEEKGKKIIASTYKAKSRSRKKKGFRPQYTKVLVEKISTK